jgi:hypothetical protein
MSLVVGDLGGHPNGAQVPAVDAWPEPPAAPILLGAPMPAIAEDRPWTEWLVGSPGVRSAYVSTVVHVLLLTVLALLFVRDERRLRPTVIQLTFDDGGGGGARTGADATPEVVAPAGDAPPQPEPPQAATAPAVPPALADAAAQPPAAAVIPPVVPVDAAEGDRIPTAPLHAVAARLPVPAAAAPAAEAANAADPFASRRGASRGKLAGERGGSAASEAAVERGLAWLAMHQGPEGAWRFDLSNCHCRFACRDRGTVTSTTAATGIALLPFLGAGHTQVEGRYRETVNRGLYYLVSRMEPTARGGDLSEGTMYGHGVATLALAEAFGMTRDDLLARPVADAVRFIVTAQDMHTGGWRYLPGQAGDTTVTAWQLAALKSAALAGVTVPSPTIDGVRRFFDRVQARDGEAYGYLGPQAQPCTSAIGLFCRLHTGWAEKDKIDRGLAALARRGPAPTAIYTNFYLAQALLQGGHEAWPRWNRANRDQLVAAQERAGHEEGSWFVADPDTAPGGRLAHTALAVLTLEVYYRLLPLYRPEAVDLGL